MALVILHCCRPVMAAQKTVECRVTSQTADGIYVNSGKADGLEPGFHGIVQRIGREIARVEVEEVATNSALLRVFSTRGNEYPRVGDRVSVFVDRRSDGQVAADKKQRSPTVKELSETEEPFVPLLAPAERSRGFPEPSNLFHGRVWVNELFQTDLKNSEDFSTTRVGSSGTLERINRTPWSLDWSGDVSYRDGNALRNTRDYQELRPRLFRLNFSRRFDNGSYLRLGRVLPRELPSVGYVDGVQGDKAINDSFRIGAITGFKPTRGDLGINGKEPLAVAYGTVEAGEWESLYYSGTAGILGSLYEGKADRLAVLLDQRANLGRWLSLFSSSEVDLDAGGAEFRSGVRLTRFDVYASSRVTSFLTVRGGTDHFEQLDTQAERGFLESPGAERFDRGYWRYWVGSSLYLPWNVHLDKQVGFIDGPMNPFTARWQVTLSRTSTQWLAGTRVSVTVYNIEGADAEGYGGQVYAFVPLCKGNVSIQPSLGFRLLDSTVTAEDFDLTNFSVRALWHVTSSWSVHAGVSGSLGPSIGALLWDMGVSFRW